MMVKPVAFNDRKNSYKYRNCAPNLIAHEVIPL